MTLSMRFSLETPPLCSISADSGESAFGYNFLRVDRWLLDEIYNAASSSLTMGFGGVLGL